MWLSLNFSGCIRLACQYFGKMYSRQLFSYGGFVAINVHGKQTVDKPFYVYKPCYVCNRCLFTRSLETVDSSS